MLRERLEKILERDLSEQQARELRSIAQAIGEKYPYDGRPGFFISPPFSYSPLTGQDALFHARAKSVVDILGTLTFEQIERFVNTVELIGKLHPKTEQTFQNILGEAIQKYRQYLADNIFIIRKDQP